MFDKASSAILSVITFCDFQFAALSLVCFLLKVFIKQEDAMPDSGVQEVGRSSPETEDPHSVWMERYERLGLHMIAKESDLGRQYRFAADGLLKQEQCEDMLGLMGVSVARLVTPAWTNLCVFNLLLCLLLRPFVRPC